MAVVTIGLILSHWQLIHSSFPQSSHLPIDSVVIFSEKDEFEKLTAAPAKTAKR